MSSILGHGHGTEYIWITAPLSWVGGFLSIYLPGQGIGKGYG